MFTVNRQSGLCKPYEMYLKLKDVVKIEIYCKFQLTGQSRKRLQEQQCAGKKFSLIFQFRKYFTELSANRKNSVNSISKFAYLATETHGRLVT